MAILRLTNGSDIKVKLGVGETLAALGAGANGDFVELQGEDGPVHIRPSGVIAVVDSLDRKASGFRVVRD